MNTTYVVVRNDEEQYSTWPATREVPAGWTVVEDAPRGPQESCLEWIGEHWQVILPRSARPAYASGAAR